MALAQKQFDVAGQHIREMREMNATDGEIQRAQIEATKNFALAALDAETKKRAELIDLAKQQRDEESKTARANYDNARRLGDAVAGEQERRERDTLQRQIKMAEALGLKSSAVTRQSGMSLGSSCGPGWELSERAAAGQSGRFHTRHLSSL